MLREIHRMNQYCEPVTRFLIKRNKRAADATAEQIIVQLFDIKDPQKTLPVSTLYAGLGFPVTSDIMGRAILSLLEKGAIEQDTTQRKPSFSLTQGTYAEMLDDQNRIDTRTYHQILPKAQRTPCY